MNRLFVALVLASLLARSAGATDLAAANPATQVLATLTTDDGLFGRTDWSLGAACQPDPVAR